MDKAPEKYARRTLTRQAVRPGTLSSGPCALIDRWWLQWEVIGSSLHCKAMQQTPGIPRIAPIGREKRRRWGIGLSPAGADHADGCIRLLPRQQEQGTVEIS